MENASKALIIAGAILISILLISIGIILINAGTDVTGSAESTMASQKIQTFNSQFTVYEGTKKGSEIRGLFNAVRSSNAVDESHQITISGVTSAANLKANKTYTVTISYASADSTTTEKGYINQISIMEGTSTPTNTTNTI